MLVHANPFDRRMFIYQVAHFSTFFKVTNIDLRGYGYWDKPAIPITMTDLCEYVVAVCRQEEVPEAFFSRRQRRRRYGFSSVAAANLGTAIRAASMATRRRACRIIISNI